MSNTLEKVEFSFDAMMEVQKRLPEQWKIMVADFLSTNDGLEEFKSLARLRAIVVDFVNKHDITCAETIYQMDDVIIDAYDFIHELVEEVGYKESDEEEDD